jgi:hemin uptake protein HemP
MISMTLRFCHRVSDARTPQPAPARSAPSNEQLRRIDSHELLGTAQEVEISHTGQIYRLRLTALGKLILTK